MNIIEKYFKFKGDVLQLEIYGVRNNIDKYRKRHNFIINFRENERNLVLRYLLAANIDYSWSFDQNTREYIIKNLQNNKAVGIPLKDVIKLDHLNIISQLEKIS